MSCRVQMKMWDGSVMDISATVTKNGDKRLGILVMHPPRGL